MATHARREYSPSFFRKVFIVISEQLYCFIVLVFGALPYIFDLIRTRFFQSANSRLPNSMTELLNPKLFSQLSNRTVSKVELSNQMEQHANSTDRAWFQVTFDDNNSSQEESIFVKIQAKTALVRATMSIYGIYRNEIHAYADIKFPIRTPKIYFAKWTKSQFVLAMEDLRNEQVKFLSLWESRIDSSLARKIISSYAKLHAAFWNNPPPGIWDDKSRPDLPRTQGLVTLYLVRRKCPGVIPDDMFKVFEIAMWNFDKIRKFYSRKGYKTLAHGDSHSGNMYVTQSGEVGVFDLQCVSEEHPMRDIAYFLISSCTEELLSEEEEDLIRFYLSELEKNGISDIPSFEECWLQYRMQSFYAMYAFVFSGGFSDLMDTMQSNITISRIVANMGRIDAPGALYDLLDGKI